MHGTGPQPRWLASLAALIVASLAALTACGPQPTLPEGALAPIKVGVVTSLTGTLGTDGPGWANSARVAAREVNAAGGPIDGRPIELVVVDDETNPGRAEAIATRLVNEDEVVAVIGAAASSITLGLAAVTGPAQIPQVSCCSTSDLITSRAMGLPEEERFLFRTAPSDILQAKVVSIAATQLACSSLAVLHLDDSYGQPFGDAIVSEFRSGGGIIAAQVPFADEQASYTAELTMIRDAMPDCIALVAFPGSAGTIVQNWASLSGTPDVTWIGTDGVRAPGLVEQVGDPALIDGFFGTSPVTDGSTREYNAFRDRYRAFYGEDPIPFSSNQYDAVALLSLAIARAGTTDGVAVRDALREVAGAPSDPGGLILPGQLAEGLAEVREGIDIDYQGASGNVDFDALGNVVTSYEIWRYDAPGSTASCDGPRSVVPGDRGAFCRFRTLNAEEIR